MCIHFWASRIYIWLTVLRIANHFEILFIFHISTRGMGTFHLLHEIVSSQNSANFFLLVYNEMFSMELNVTYVLLFHHTSVRPCFCQQLLQTLTLDFGILAYKYVRIVHQHVLVLLTLKLHKIWLNWLHSK